MKFGMYENEIVNISNNLTHSNKHNEPILRINFEGEERPSLIASGHTVLESRLEYATELYTMTPAVKA